MDIFVLNPDHSPGTIITGGIEKAIWTERYNRPGEFLFEGDPIRLMAALPLGALISHSKTNEIMVVEAHTIDEYEDSTANVTVIGRSLDAVIMENRVVTWDHPIAINWTSLGEYSGSTAEYTGDMGSLILEYTTAWHAAEMILRACLVISDRPEENLSDFVVQNNLSAWYGGASQDRRVIKYLSLLSDSVYSFLQSSDSGLKTERPSSERIIASDDPSPNTSIYFTLHQGIDKTSGATAIEFNMSHGDLKTARYVWSNRDVKNGFYVGTHNEQYQTMLREYQTGISGWNARFASINADDWAIRINEEVGFDSEFVAEGLRSRGLDSINRSSPMLIDATISNTATAKYGIDFLVGDIVTVVANYGNIGPMRVIEHAITQDSTGEESVPTLAPPYFQGYISSGGEG